MVRQVPDQPIELGDCVGVADQREWAYGLRACSRSYISAIGMSGRPKSGRGPRAGSATGRSAPEVYRRRAGRRLITAGPTSRADSRPTEGGTGIAGSDELIQEDPEAPRLEGIDGTGTDLSRLLALSDGVFAFALTFLAVSLLLPQMNGGSSLPSLTSYLTRLEPAFVGYLLSFFVIATWWSTHHRLFSSIVRYDPTVVRLNSLFLLVISVTPFLVSILFAYSPDGFGRGSESSQLAVALYGGIQGLGGLSLLAIWRHATRRHRLLRPTVPEEWVRATEANQLLIVVVFAVSTGIAFVAPLVAELTWIVMILGLGRLLRRRGPSRRNAPVPRSPQ